MNCLELRINEKLLFILRNKFPKKTCFKNQVSVEEELGNDLPLILIISLGLIFSPLDNCISKKIRRKNLRRIK